MPEPTTSYQARYPNDKYPGNTQQERSLANERLVAEARKYNKHDEEIQAIQCFLGLAKTPFDPSGPDPGTGTTIIDRLTRIGGTAEGCLEEGILCNYGGPDGIDPSAASYIDTTGDWIGAPWIDPTGLPPRPPAAPIPGGGGPAAAPWPGPGGGGNPGGPVFPVPPWVPPAPAGPVQPTLPWQWFLKYGIQYWQWVQATNAWRWSVQSGEVINLWSRPYDELWEFFTDIINLFGTWPTGRTSPSADNRASIFDVLLGDTIIAQLLKEALGIKVYTGTVSSGEIEFDTGSDPLDTGAPGVSVGDILVVVSNNVDSTYAKANFTDLENDSAVSVLGTGVVAGAAGPFHLIAGSALDEPTGTDVRVLVFSGTPRKTTQGDENTWRNELIAGGPTFITTDVPVDGKGARPIFTVWARTGAGAAWVPLEYNGGGVATNANDFGYTVGTQTIDTFVAAGYTQVRVQYMCSRVT